MRWFESEVERSESTRRESRCRLASSEGRDIGIVQMSSLAPINNNAINLWIMLV